MYIGLVRSGRIVRTMVWTETGTRATERRSAFSLSTVLLFVTGCAVFTALVVARVRDDYQVFLLIWGGCVALLWISVALLHPQLRLLVPMGSVSHRENHKNKVLRLSLLTGAVPTVGWITFCSGCMCPGPFGGASDLFSAIIFYALLPLAGVTLTYAMVKNFFAFDVRIFATQIAAACVIGWPFVFIILANLPDR